MKSYTLVLHLELEQNEDDPALWDWHDLLDLGSSEVATVEEIFDEKKICGQSFMAGAYCILNEGHSNGHRNNE